VENALDLHLMGCHFRTEIRPDPYIPSEKYKSFIFYLNLTFISTLFMDQISFAA
jgi:hypothetical protein